jgi:heparin binding hemagglutinin HbhA
MAENNPNLEDLKAPLLAAVGAADLALATVNEILATLRDRAEEARTEASTRVEERRAALTKLQEDLPQRAEELRGKLSTEELRKAAEGYVEQATETYNNLVERGEAALERLRSQSDLKDLGARAEGYVDQAVELTQEALGNVSSQTRAVGERAAKLVGVELPAKKAPAKAPAKKAPAKKAAPAAKKAPAKAPAKKAAPAKKVTQK